MAHIIIFLRHTIYSTTMSADTYLTKGKMPLLNAPGVKYDGLLVSTMNSTIDTVEAQFGQGIYVQDLPTKTFNTQSDVKIGNGPYLYTTELYLQLYPRTSATTPYSGVGDGDTLQADCYVNDGWGYNAIEYYEYQVGTTNTIQRVDGEANWMSIAAQCKDDRHRSELWQLGGTFRNPVVGNGQLQEAIEACVLITLPWSRACDGLPYPSDLITNPVNLRIKFRGRDAIVCGTGVKPTQFKVAAVTCRQAIVDGAKSARALMAADSELVYSYPCVSAKSYTVTNIVPSATGACNLIIQQVENADLLGMAFMVVPSQNFSPSQISGGTSTIPYAPWNGVEVTDFDVRYQGQFIYKTSGLGKMYKLANMDGPQEKSSWINSNVLPGANSPFNALATDQYFVYVDFSRYRAACLPMEIPNVPRYPSQQFQLTWNVPAPYLGADVNGYTLIYCYFYTGMLSTMNGFTQFYTA